MTGLEFKIFIMAFGVLVVIPAFLLSIGRALTTCDGDDDQGGYAMGVVAYIVYSAFVLVVFLIKNWDDSLNVGYILGLSIAPTLGVSFHVLLILLGTKFFSLFINPKEESICVQTHAFIFMGLTILWVVIIDDKGAGLIKFFGG